MFVEVSFCRRISYFSDVISTCLFMLILLHVSCDVKRVLKLIVFIGVGSQVFVFDLAGMDDLHYLLGDYNFESDVGCKTKQKPC